VIGFRTCRFILAAVFLSAQNAALGLDCNGDCGNWQGVDIDIEGSELPLGVPYRECFEEAAAEHELPVRLLAAVGSGESDFNSSAVSKRGAIGVMQIRWPVTAKHLGFGNRSLLFDACTNIDAGARYLKELSAKYASNPHYMLGAYYFGPSRVRLTDIPAAAARYSDYIYERYLGLVKYHGSPVKVLDLETSISAWRWKRALSRSFPAIQFSVTSSAPYSHHLLASGDEDAMSKFLARYNEAFIF
jgi:soluble lytic murein transglycosylase-like protein